MAYIFKFLLIQNLEFQRVYYFYNSDYNMMIKSNSREFYRNRWRVPEWPVENDAVNFGAGRSGITYSMMKYIEGGIQGAVWFFLFAY